VIKAFITSELKVVIFGIFYMLIYIMMIHESKEMKVWNMKYDHCAMKEELYARPREQMK